MMVLPLVKERGKQQLIERHFMKSLLFLIFNKNTEKASEEIFAECVIT